MPILRIENFRHGAWIKRGEGEIPADTTQQRIKDECDRCSLNHPVRAYLDGALVYENGQLSAEQIAASFRL